MKKILMVATVAIAVLMLQTNSFALDATRSVQTVHRADGTEPMPPHFHLEASFDGTEPMPPHSRLDGTEPMPPHSRLDDTEPMPPHSR